MDFWRTVIVLVRRWYVTLPAFVITLGIAGLTYATSPVEYQSGAVLVLTSPLAGGTESAGSTAQRSATNPLLNFAQGLSLTGSILIQELTSPDTVSSLGIQPGGTTTYQVNNGTSNPELLESGPFVFIEGTAPSPRAAQDITARLAAEAADILAERQNVLGAPESTHIEIQVVVSPTVGRPLTGSPMRAAGASAALAALMSLVAVYGAESFATHRRRPSQARQEEVRRSPITTVRSP